MVAEEESTTSQDASSCIGLLPVLAAPACSSILPASNVWSENNTTRSNRDNSSSTSDTRKKGLTEYTKIHVPGDGRCLFRSISHGACVRSWQYIPDEAHQKELADELRACVADEFVKRRKETEWFIPDGQDFEAYVARIRKPWVWGGEPELLMASHVLQMPITVYIHEERSGGLISIAEYGHQDYGSEDPIKVLYNVHGHYDALHTASMEKVPSITLRKKKENKTRKRGLISIAEDGHQESRLWQ